MLELLHYMLFLLWLLGSLAMFAAVLWMDRSSSQWLAHVSGGMFAFCAIGWLMFESAWAWLVAVVMLWQGINAWRAVRRRWHTVLLRIRIKKTWALLSVAQIVILAIAFLLQPSAQSMLAFIGYLSLGFGFTLLVVTLVRVGGARSGRGAPAIADRDTPTVTLAIAARNETHALTETLQAALKSDYPKLEILVLDDCSQDQTPQLIRDFAHDGVRFVRGSQPSDGWLGKNYAYEVLMEEASGDYILFCGVDVHIGVQTIRRLIEHALHNNLSMVSVMPQRRNKDIAATLLQPLRYYWQVALPLFGVGRVPVLSACWMVRRQDLMRLGGMKSVSGAIVPEAHFARRLSNAHSYSFLISDVAWDITTRKRPASQWATATRVLYPSLKREPAYVLATILCIGLFFLMPYVAVCLVLCGFFTGNLAVIFVLSVACSMGSFLIFAIRQNPHGWAVSVAGLPLALLLEQALMCWSMIQYEFGDVVWKGRNVCLPVMNRRAKSRS